MKVDLTKERKYFIIQYSHDGLRARRITEPDPNYYHCQDHPSIPVEEWSFHEIDNTQEDVYGLAEIELGKWIDLPEPRF